MISIYLIFFFLGAMLDLLCCVQVFSSCGERGLLSSYGVPASHRSDFSCCEAWILGYVGFSSCLTWAQ